MNKSAILFLGFVFLFTTSYAQLKIELNKVYSSSFLINNNIKVKTLASNLSFNSKKLITLLNNEFGVFNEAAKVDLGTIYLWENINIKKVNTKNCSLIVNEASYSEGGENIDGKITYTKIPTINVYILDEDRNNILDFDSKKAKMEKFLKKLINKASKN